MMRHGAGPGAALVVTRRGADGRHQPIAVIDVQVLLERALRRAAWAGSAAGGVVRVASAGL